MEQDTTEPWWTRVGLLFSQRKKQQDIERQELEGVDFWSTHIPREARVKILFAFNDCMENSYGGSEAATGLVRANLLRSRGVLYLYRQRQCAQDDLANFVLEGDDDDVIDVIECVIRTLSDSALQSRFQIYGSVGTFLRSIARILREHRLAYDLVDGHVIALSDQFMHQAVVRPTLRLLAGRSDLANVEAAYLAALEEMAKNRPSDAITDAGTALQEMLLAAGCAGTTLSALTKSGMGRGLFRPSDVKLLEWLAATRNNSGDAHLVTDATPRDAWLMIQVVGAVILWMAREVAQ